MVAGDDSGLIQVFDINSRAILKTWTAHKPLPVWMAGFGNGDLTTLMSTGDDKIVRLWDLPSNEPLAAFHGHADYIRTGAFMPASSTMLLSGSYDKTVRLWDSRAPDRSALVFKHAHPIERVLPMPSGTTVLAASGSTISVLDLVAAKPQHVITNHQKTVLDLSLASHARRLVSGGLDGHVKIFETTGWNVVAGFKFSSSVRCVSVIPAGADGHDRHLAVGTAGRDSATLSLRTRLAGADLARDRERKKQMQALLSGTIAAYDSKREKRKRLTQADKALRAQQSVADVIIDDPLHENQHSSRARRRREARWHAHLRHGRYAQALDHVLDKTQKDHSPKNVLTLLVALRHRSALREALESRDEDTVLPPLRFVCTRIQDPRYRSVCIDAALHLVDLYARYADRSQDLETLFRTLVRRVKTEVERCQVAIQTGGMVEGLVAGTAAMTAVAI